MRASTRSLRRQESSSFALGLFRGKYGVAEGVARLREENLESGHAVDRCPMFGVVTIQDTNRPLRVHDRKCNDFRRQHSTEPIDELDIDLRLLHLPAMSLT